VLLISPPLAPLLEAGLAEELSLLVTDSVTVVLDDGEEAPDDAVLWDPQGVVTEVCVSELAPSLAPELTGGVEVGSTKVGVTSGLLVDSEDVGVWLKLPYGVAEEVPSVSVAEFDGALLNCPLLPEVEDAGLDCG
jgi:hypothetical protein